MNMNELIHFLRQIPGKIGVTSYSSLANPNDPSNVAFVRQLQREIKKQDILEVPFSKLKLVVFDLETTGFYPYNGDQILSFGAVKVEDGCVIEEETFYSLVHHERKLRDEIAALTGISNGDLLSAPSMEIALNEFFQFVKSGPLVAHHASHERSFMQYGTWSVLKTNFEHRVIDTSFLLKIIEPELDFVSLDDCCNYFGIEVKKRHHALYDAIATAKLWVECSRLVEKKGFRHLKDVYTYIATQKSK